MAKKRASKRKAPSANSSVSDKDNDENFDETNSVENGEASTSKSTPGKKKKSVGASKATPKSESPKTKGKPKSKSDDEEEKETEDEEDYEVEKILDVDYGKNGKREFLIRWKNYSSKHDSWEPEENLSCDELISKFLEVQEERAKQPRKDLREKPKTVTRYAAPAGRKSKRTAGNRKTYTEQEEDDE